MHDEGLHEEIRFEGRWSESRACFRLVAVNLNGVDAFGEPKGSGLASEAASRE